MTVLKDGVEITAVEVLEQLQEDLSRVREELSRLLRVEWEMNNIVATLIVNCKPERELGKLGLSYNEGQSVHDNMVRILARLVAKASPKVEA